MKLSVQGTALQATRRFDPRDIEAMSLQLTGIDMLVGVGSVPVPDRLNADEWYSGRRVVVLDGPSDAFRFEGYITSQTRDRPTGDAIFGRQASLQVGDANELLHHRSANKYARPAETDVARVLAFAADQWSDLGLDTSWVLNEFTVDMPAKTYDGDDIVSELASDLGDWAGKTLFVHADWTGGVRTLHLHYHRLNDRGHSVPFALTDDGTHDWSSSLPFKATTPHREADGFELYNKVIARNADGSLTTTVTDSTSMTQHDADGVKHETILDTEAADMTELTALANNLLASRKGERYSYSATIEKLTAAQANSLTAGSLIVVTSTVWALSAVTVRVSNVSFRPILRQDGTFEWAADVELDRPIRRARPKSGNNKPKVSKCGDIAGAELIATELGVQQRKASPGTFASTVDGLVGWVYNTVFLVIITAPCGSIDGNHSGQYGQQWSDPYQARQWQRFDTSAYSKADCAKGAVYRYYVEITDCACGPYELVANAGWAGSVGGMTEAIWKQGDVVGVIDLSKLPDGVQGYIDFPIPAKYINYGGYTTFAIRPKASWQAGCALVCAGEDNNWRTTCCETDGGYCIAFGQGHHQIQPCNVHHAIVNPTANKAKLVLTDQKNGACLTDWEDALCGTEAHGCTSAQAAENKQGCDDPCTVLWWAVPCGKYKAGTLQVQCGGRVLKRGVEFAESSNRKCFKMLIPCTEGTPQVRYVMA